MDSCREDISSTWELEEWELCGETIWNNGLMREDRNIVFFHNSIKDRRNKIQLSYVLGGGSTSLTMRYLLGCFSIPLSLVYL